MKRLLALVAVLAGCLALLILQRRSKAIHAGRNDGPTNLISREFLGRFTAIEQGEQQLDDTLWAPERRAELLGAVFDNLWDKLNQTSNKLEVLASFPVGELVVGDYNLPQRKAHQIVQWLPGAKRSTWFQNEWEAFLDKAASDGWSLEHIEFRQRGFDPASGTNLEKSKFSFRADAIKTNGLGRVTLEGDLLVDWIATPMPQSQPAIKQLDATGVSIRRREGNPAFELLMAETIQPPEKWLFTDPLITYDLDGDGLPEIMLVGANLVYRKGASGQYERETLCKYPPGKILSAIVADFDGDGLADLICAKPEGLFLYKGSARGTFEEPPRSAWAANPPLKYAQVLTCGDIDHDGDLDLFLGQYKSPYFHGQMPTPYFDANDADPSYLLVNDGKGNFTDATDSSGLKTKRFRRTYSASLVRLNTSTNLDLIVASDFAGLDIYRNDGMGHFTDVTRKLIPDAMGFGMAHALSDFNADGRLDLLMIGMDSPAVDRLEHLGLWRSDVKEDHTMRSRLACGNRLLLAKVSGNGFEQTTLNESIAHSGWSWGCGAADLDNDRFPDVYVANGHESRATVHDYDPEFWLHDIYVAGSTNDRAADLYFQSKFTRTRARGQSYGGYEINRLYLNQDGETFLESGYLLGVGLEQDCRNVVTVDLDGDGKTDLLVTTFEVWPQPKQTLRVYRNRLADTGNWIGFRFREQAGNSPVGTTVTIDYGGRKATRQIVTGDSYRCQSGNVVHFGIGKSERVDQAEFTRADGATGRMDAPGINQYHDVDRKNH